MASNFTQEEDEPMHPAGLDMTRESLRDILDGNEVNVSTALPSVPQDTTNPFINPNQTLADVIHGRDLGPLSSLKVTDADLIIHNLNKELNAAAEKNDNSVALLQRMDQRQKQLETELATLRAEKDAAIQERRDHTINQDRLAENLRHNLEKEYADKEQNYLRQLKQELKSKTSAIRDQCKMEFDQELKKLKEEWNQERLKTNEQHNAQISMVLKEIDALKEHSRAQQKAEVVEPGDKISDLKTTAFDFVPGTVNTKRGGAVNLHEETILRSKNEDAPPIPPRKHVHFTSTPRHPVQSNLFDSDDDNPITGHSGNPFIGYPNNPFTQQQVRGHIPLQTTVDTDATTIIGNTMSAVASEFKKMREPKLAKLKGGITSGASLFFNSWVKANILGCRVRAVGAKGALCNAAMAPESPDTPVPTKRRKIEEDTTIAAQLSMCIKDNKELHKKLDAFDPSKIVEVVAQAVAGGYPKSSHKPYTYQKQQASQGSNPFSKPYLGPPREPQVTPGADGSLNPALSCRYCKDTGHDVSNCAKVKRKEALKAATASQQSKTANKGN